MRAFTYRWKVNNEEYIGTAAFNNETDLKNHIKQLNGQLVEIIEQHIVDERLSDKTCDNITKNKMMTECCRTESVFSSCNAKGDMPFLIKWENWNIIIRTSIGLVLTVMGLLFAPIYYKGHVLVMSIQTKLILVVAVILVGTFSIYCAVAMLKKKSWARTLSVIASYIIIGVCVFMLIKNTKPGYFFWIAGITFATLNIWYFNRKSIRVLYADNKAFDKNEK